MENHLGFEISCHGGTGAIDATPVNGIPPYTFAWTGSNSYSATTEDISGPAGTYICLVTDSVGDTISKHIILHQPAALTATLIPSDFNGFSISIHGNDDGEINTEVGGGATPYSYAWSNSATASSIKDLTVGSYSVTITDQNGCTINKNTTITEPTSLSITSLTVSHTISCNKGKDGEAQYIILLNEQNKELRKQIEQIKK